MPEKIFVSLLNKNGANTVSGALPACGEIEEILMSRHTTASVLKLAN